MQYDIHYFCRTPIETLKQMHVSNKLDLCKAHIRKAKTGQRNSQQQWQLSEFADICQAQTNCPEPRPLLKAQAENTYLGFLASAQ